MLELKKVYFDKFPIEFYNPEIVVHGALPKQLKETEITFTIRNIDFAAFYHKFIDGLPVSCILYDVSVSGLADSLNILFQEYIICELCYETLTITLRNKNAPIDLFEVFASHL